MCRLARLALPSIFVAGLLAASCSTPTAALRPAVGPWGLEEAGRPSGSAWAADGSSAGGSAGQDGGAGASDLAMQLSNPVASLTSVPLQFNWDQDIGSADGERLSLNIQPVVPISLDEDWNMISRTILPVVDLQDVPAGNDETGIGDIVQSLFFSPVAPTEGGWIWGAGPVVLLPTASDDTLGGGQWGLGPTAVALRQQGPWTYGALVNHIWSVAGDDDRSDVNATFLQPFLTYTTPQAWSFGLNTEFTYDWQAEEASLPLNAAASKVLKLGGQLVQVGGGLRYWLDAADNGPEGLGLRFNLVFLFPK